MSKLLVLTKNKEFNRVYSKGKFSASKNLVVYTLPNHLNTVRFGITTSKKIGNAVIRNRMRRLIRENLRIIDVQIKDGMDIVIVARKAEASASFDTVGKELRYLFNKLNLFQGITNGKNT
ncbi:MAG: ribonuclease P protein component [Clostridiaceae bacterium]|nr:ribonuclease P protein component [Clostridiaceae bacterium]